LAGRAYLRNNEQVILCGPGAVMPVCDLPVLRYTPFDSGKYDMSPGLSHFQLATDNPHQRLIQLDHQYPLYRANKQRIRADALTAHWGVSEFLSDTQRQVNQTLIEQLCAAYPQYFCLEAPGRLACLLSGDLLEFSPDYVLQAHPVYSCLFDALAAQIQEDLAVWQLQGERDWLAALHVCAPNGWAPAEKVGLSFDQVHAPVPGMERQRAQVLPLLKGLIQKPAFCRFIWDLRTCPALNHHPAVASFPPFGLDNPTLYARVERQVLYGLPSCNAVLFMIRTYVYPVQDLTTHNWVGLERALAGMAPELLAYKRLTDEVVPIRAWLQQLIRTQA
jgi:hypothetical protein